MAKKETIAVYFARKVSDFPNGDSVAEVGRDPFATREGATRECVCQWSDLIFQKGSKEVDSKNTALGRCGRRPHSMRPFSVAQAAFRNGLVVNWDVVEAKVDERRLLKAAVLYLRRDETNGFVPAGQGLGLPAGS